MEAGGELGDFIGFNEAQRRFGMSLEVLRRRVARGELTLYRAPLDDRRKLLRVSDLELLQAPREVRAEKMVAGVAA